MSGLGYNGDAEYIELKEIMLDIKKKTNNIEQLNNIISEIDNDDSFAGLRS